MRSLKVSPKTQKRVETSLSSSTPILMLYHASWCGHCQHFMPEWKKAKDELEHMAGILTAEVEAENMSMLPSSLTAIQGYPTLMVLKDGKQVKEYQGDRSAADVVKFAKQFAEKVKTVAEKPPSKASPASKKTKKEKEYKGKEKQKK